MLKGKWTYRSFNNDPKLIDSDPQKALALLFGEGILTFTDAPTDRWRSTLSFGSEWNMDLAGFIEKSQSTDGMIFTGTGVGRDGTNTAGWVYQYRGIVLAPWPHGQDEVKTIVGTVIRTVRHGNAPAGKVASFIAVCSE